jgi:hypothetical protein
MADAFLGLSDSDRREALLVAEGRTGRPAHLLEKDVWVVWALEVLFGAPFADRLVFKGGTSLSKAYAAITRFSEDIDLTYDIRALLPGLADDAFEGLPPSRSQAEKWSKRVRSELPAWISRVVLPTLEEASARHQVRPAFSTEAEKIYLDYPSVVEASSYAQTRVMLEFGGRSTGEPCEPRQIVCDASKALAALGFPEAIARVMCVERTVWEKMTAMHVVCHGGKQRERMARHWHDVARLHDSGHVAAALRDRQLAAAVARHKSLFFVEKDGEGNAIDYEAAVSGSLRLVPDSVVHEELRVDYERMVTDGWIEEGTGSFAEVMERCRGIQLEANDSPLGG